jgi:protein MpaA
MSLQKFWIFGKTARQCPIPAFDFGTTGPRVLLIGGIHGDEPEGIAAANGLLESFQNSFTEKLRLTLVPAVNMDGLLDKARTNGNGVDLNRNMPTKDWTAESRAPRYFPGTAAGSEPENQALMKFMDQEKPQLIISLHSWFPVLNTNGDCRGEAEVLQKMTGYKIDDDIGYPTPGSLGTYAGLERAVPTLTYEIERDLKLDEVIRIHVPAIREALKWTAANRKDLRTT